MFQRLKSKLRFIIENAYMEQIMLYLIIFLIVAIGLSMMIIYPIALFVRDITGSLLDPIVPLVKIVLSFEFIFLSGIIFYILSIILIIIVRVRKGKFRDGLLIYDIFSNYNKDFKTLSSVILAILFMIFYLIYFFIEMISYGGLEFFNLIGLLGVIAIVLTIIAYVGQVNKILSGIKNIGRLNEGDTSLTGQYQFTQQALSMLQNTDERIKLAVDEQLKSERLKTELITNISHDLKTPLTSIINYTDLLKKHDIEDEEVKEYVEVLDRNSQRLKVLITDLVYASKAETGNVEIELDTLELNELVSQVYGEFDYLFREKDITFVFDPIEDFYVLADSNHLGRVLINLMDNAIKYSQENTRIYASTKNEGGYVLFSLKNISKEKLNISPDELMEQFVRGERSRHTDGSGLGLYISRSLIELMGGKLVLSIDGDLFEVEIFIPSAKINMINNSNVNEDK